MEEEEGIGEERRGEERRGEERRKVKGERRDRDIAEKGKNGVVEK